MYSTRLVVHQTDQSSFNQDSPFQIQRFRTAKKHPVQVSTALIKRNNTQKHNIHATSNSIRTWLGSRKNIPQDKAETFAHWMQLPICEPFELWPDHWSLDIKYPLDQVSAQQMRASCHKFDKHGGSGRSENCVNSVNNCAQCSKCHFSQVQGSIPEEPYPPMCEYLTHLLHQTEEQNKGSVFCVERQNNLSITRHQWGPFQKDITDFSKHWKTKTQTGISRKMGKTKDVAH